MQWAMQRNFLMIFGRNDGCGNRRQISRRIAFNRSLIATQTAFNQCCDIHSRPRHGHDQPHAHKWPYFRAFSRASAFLSSHGSITATGHRRASRSRTRNKKDRATSTTAHNPISIQLTIQPTAPKIQAKSKQMYFSFFSATSRPCAVTH